MKHSETVTLASYQMAWNIAWAKRPYNEGESIKNTSVMLLKSCLPENNKLKRMVADVQLSRHTVEHKILDINTVIKS